MTGFVRRAVAVIGVGCAVLGASAGVSWAGEDPPVAAQVSDRQLDGFRLGHVPSGLGESVSDFAYEWGGVAFASRVWERGPDADGAYSVDLMVSVLRGDRLRTGGDLLDFMTIYLEEDSPEWRPIVVRGRPGWIGADRVFFLAAPGVAVSILLDAERFAWWELLRIAYGVCPMDR